jgi:hypothetical protein
VKSLSFVSAVRAAQPELAAAVVFSMAAPVPVHRVAVAAVRPMCVKAEANSPTV